MKLFYDFIFLCILYSSAVARNAVFRISNGVPAAQITEIHSHCSVMRATTEYPFMAQIRYEVAKNIYEYLCGGAIIKNNVILTAGHCITHRSEIPLVALAGTYEKIPPEDETVQIAAVKDVLVHEDYDFGKNKNDIAIVWTEERFIFGKYVSSIDMAKKDYTDKIAVTLGWEYNDDVNKSQYLLKAELKIMTNDKCRKKIKKYKDLSVFEGVVCGIDLNKDKATCKIDSGSPLFVKDGEHYVLVGLTSCGICTIKHGQRHGKKVKIFKYKAKYPANFANIHHYKEWIDHKVKHHDI